MDTILASTQKFDGKNFDEWDVLKISLISKALKSLVHLSMFYVVANNITI